MRGPTIYLLRNIFTRAKLEQEIRLQRRSFERVLRDDRNKYEARTEAAEIEAECRWVLFHTGASDKLASIKKNAMLNGELLKQCPEVHVRYVFSGDNVKTRVAIGQGHGRSCRYGQIPV